MDYIDKLRKLRETNGYNQADIAEVLETTQQHYSSYERKTHEMPVRHLVTLCKLYKVSADWLLGLTED